MTRVNLDSRDQQQVSVHWILRVQFSDRLDTAVIDFGKLPRIAPAFSGDRQSRQRRWLKRLLRIKIDRGQILQLFELVLQIVQYKGSFQKDLLADVFSPDRGDSDSGQFPFRAGKRRLDRQESLLRTVYVFRVFEEQADRYRIGVSALPSRTEKDKRSAKV